MEQTLCQITAQSIVDGKNKCGQLFNLMVDADHFMYCKDECIEVIKKMLEEQSNEYCKYEYIDHELIFHTPMVLDSKFFETNITRMLRDMSEESRINL